MTGIRATFLYLTAVLVTLFLPLSAQAGHLFTQASANTPINLTAGTGIQITQLTNEGTGTSGNLSLNFSGDWSSGDAIRITIRNYTQTFTYDSPLAGTTQTTSALVVADPTLQAAGITLSGSMPLQWTVIATSGTFTFTGYRIYVADGTLNGTGADTITQSQVVSASSLGSGFVPYSNSTNVGLARELDALNGVATGELANVITIVSAMTAESKQLALKLMAPETSQATGQSAMNTAIAALDTVQLRLDLHRSGVGLSNFEHSNGLSSGDAALNKNMWMKVFGAKASQDAKDGFAGSNDSLYGTLIGYDAPVGQGWIAGGAFGYAKTNVNMSDYRSGDGADIETYQLTGYFSRAFKSWYLDGMLAYAKQDYSATRNTHLTGIAVGDFKGDMYGLRLLAGMPVPVGRGFTVTPYASLDLNRVKQDSYTESGAGALSLNVAGSTADRVRSHLGAELSTLKKLNNGSVLRPAVKLNWRHEFNDDGVTTVTSFVGGGSQFETFGQNINRDVFGLSARLNWEKTEQMNVVVELGGEMGSGYQSYSGQIMGGYRF